MIRRVLPALLVGVCALLVASPAGARSLPDGVAVPALAPLPIDEEPEDCTQNLPATYSTDITGSAGTVVLDLLVILDGVPQSFAQQAVAAAAKPYSDIDVTLNATYREAAFPPDSEREDPDTDKPRPAIDAQRLIESARSNLGGARPQGVDVVYVMTAKDLYLAESNGTSSDVAGWADCVGGVRYPKRAFATGEVPNTFNSLGMNYYLDGAAKLVGHEVGHLLGAHHRYANCAQGAGAEDFSRMEPAICTLMFLYLDFTSLHFGTLEAAVVRGHAEDYATS